jgi:hypothetical protein
MATNKKFNVKKTVLDKFRDLIETTGCRDMEEFIATPAYKMYIDNPHPQMNSVERDYVDVIVRGIFTNKSNQDIIDEIRLLWRASGADEHQLSIDQNITIDMNIDGDDGTPEPPEDTLVLETGEVKSDTSSLSEKQTAINDALTTIGDTLKTMGINPTSIGIDLDDIGKAIESLNTGDSSVGEQSHESDNNTPDVSECKTMLDVKRVLEAALSNGYRGIIKNPLYGKPYVAPYSDKEIKSKISTSEYWDMITTNSTAKIDHRFEYIEVSDNGVQTRSQDYIDLYINEPVSV